MAKIIPGILTNDEKEYEKKLRLAEHVSDLIQIDVIDGKFANNVTVGMDIIKKYEASSSLEIQLMVVNTLPFIGDLKDVEYVRRIIVPYEAESDLDEAIYQIQNSSKQVGVSVNPTTKIKEVSSYFDKIDLITIMAGNPGFSGQPFDEKTLDRVKEAKLLSPGVAVEVDIGVNNETAPRISAAGADFLVASSALYGSEDFFLAYEKLARLASKG